MRHHVSDAYSAEQVLLNKRQIYGGAPKLHWYQILLLNPNLPPSNPLEKLPQHAENSNKVHIQVPWRSKHDPQLFWPTFPGGSLVFRGGPNPPPAGSLPWCVCTVMLGLLRGGNIMANCYAVVVCVSYVNVSWLFCWRQSQAELRQSIDSLAEGSCSLITLSCSMQ